MERYYGLTSCKDKILCPSMVSLKFWGTCLKRNVMRLHSLVRIYNGRNLMRWPVKVTQFFCFNLSVLFINKWLDVKKYFSESPLQNSRGWFLWMVYWSNEKRSGCRSREQRNRREKKRRKGRMSHLPVFSNPIHFTLRANAYNFSFVQTTLLYIQVCDSILLFSMYCLTALSTA